MFDINGDSQAFPNEQGAGGLTKREYFAAMAMQGWLSNADARGQVANAEELSMWSVRQADALLAELAK